MRQPRSEGEAFRAARLSLTVAVVGLYLAVCVLSGFWGRGGFLEGGTDVPGFVLVIGFPPLSCTCWFPIVGMIISARWLWEGRDRRAFILACINILPVAFWLPVENPGRFELRVGYYLWLASHVLWAVGIGCLRVVDRGKPGSTAKEKSVIDEL